MGVHKTYLQRRNCPLYRRCFSLFISDAYNFGNSARVWHPGIYRSKTRTTTDTSNVLIANSLGFARKGCIMLSVVHVQQTPTAMWTIRSAYVPSMHTQWEILRTDCWLRCVVDVLDWLVMRWWIHQNHQPRCSAGLWCIVRKHPHMLYTTMPAT